MQRIGILLLCALVAIATAWWLAGSGDEKPSASSASETRAESGAGFADQARSGASPSRRGASGAGGAAGAATGSERAAAAPAREPSTRAPSREAEERARAWAESNPAAALGPSESANRLADEAGGDEDAGRRATSDSGVVAAPPGLSDTEIRRRAEEKVEGAPGTPEEIAEAIAREEREIRRKAEVACHLTGANCGNPEPSQASP